jgi:hypothetical protein
MIWDAGLAGSIPLLLADEAMMAVQSFRRWMDEFVLGNSSACLTMGTQKMKTLSLLKILAVLIACGVS